MRKSYLVPISRSTHVHNNNPLSVLRGRFGMSFSSSISSHFSNAGLLYAQPRAKYSLSVNHGSWGLEPIAYISMIPIPAKRSLTFLRPSGLGVSPVTAEELPDTCVAWLLLRRFKRDQLIEILVDGRGFAVAAMSGIRWTVPG